MEITEVQIKKVNKEESRMKGIATVILDGEFAVHDIRVIEGVNGLFIAMPSKKKIDGEYKDTAHPITKEARKKFEDAIFEAYENAEDTDNEE